MQKYEKFYHGEAFGSMFYRDQVKTKTRRERCTWFSPCAGVGRSRLSGEGRERTERWRKASRTKQAGTQALHEVIPQGLIENQRPRVSDEAPGAGREKLSHHSVCHWQESGRQSREDLSGHSEAAGNHI